MSPAGEQSWPPGISRTQMRHMEPTEKSFELASSLQQEVLRRLGFPKMPAANLEGLRAIYYAWCQNVPFDNVRKTIVLRTKPHLPLPGGQSEDFFDSWLNNGTGGTCWPTSNALFELVRSLGFETRRVTGAMRDLGIVNHASVKVTIQGRDWLVDSSLLCNVPLPLNHETFVHDDPVFSAEVEFEDATHVIWSHTPPNSTYLPCRLANGSTSLAGYLAQYEQSRERSPFKQRLYARRNRQGEMVVVVGNTRYSKTAAGVESRDLSRSELCQALHDDIGLSEQIIDEWTRAGCLNASFEPPSGPKPPPVTRKPPSQRTR
jgi:arylamine N-acetyltransferase